MSDKIEKKVQEALADMTAVITALSLLHVHSVTSWDLMRKPCSV